MKKESIVYEQYQGREITATLQAPNAQELNKMIRGIQRYAKHFEMGGVSVLQKGPDPDGGYRAVVVAHNFNPFKWIKRKIEERGKSGDEKLRLRRYYRRLDTIEAKEKHRKRVESLSRKAEIEELKVRRDKARTARVVDRRKRQGKPVYVYPLTHRRKRLTPRRGRLPI